MNIKEKAKQFVYSVKCNKSIILYIYTFILFLMNFIRIFDNAFWCDEAYSNIMAQKPVRDMVAATAADVHPPLYYILIRVLYLILGNNGIAYHLSGFLPYVAIIIIGCTVIRKYFGIITSAILITMSSLMKNAIIYNVEVRMYTLAALFILIAFIAFYKLLEKNNLSSWSLFFISSLCAAYTHYYALISVAFLFAMLLPLAVFQKQYRKGIACSYLLAIIAYLPWLLVLLKTLGRVSGNFWIKQIPSFADCSKFLLDYTWIETYFIICLLVSIAYQIKILVITISDGNSLEQLNINLTINKKIEFNKEVYWILSGLLSIFGTIAIGIILSHLIRPLFVLRYIFPTSAMLYLIFGFCISKMKLRFALCPILIVLILYNNIPAYIQLYNSDFNLNKETENFLNIIKPNNNSEFISNNKHLYYTVLQYYYPQIAHKYNSDASSLVLDPEYDNIYLVWENEIDKIAKDNIEKQHYAVSKIYKGGFANRSLYHVYLLQRIDSGAPKTDQPQ